MKIFIILFLVLISFSINSQEVTPDKVIQKYSGNEDDFFNSVIANPEKCDDKYADVMYFLGTNLKEDGVYLIQALGTIGDKKDGNGNLLTNIVLRKLLDITIYLIKRNGDTEIILYYTISAFENMTKRNKSGYEKNETYNELKILLKNLSETFSEKSKKYYLAVSTELESVH